MKIAFPFGLIGLAQSFQMPHEYLFELYQLNPIVSFILTILIFDLAIYWQHRVFHLIPYLWRFHEIHHCDKEMDLTTALRFHPGEILISALYKSLLIFLFRPSVEAYIVYEIILVSMALFNHANIKISPKFDKYLRLLVVTPNMHYTHHSVENRLMNLNFGNAFSFWDRIFISYTIERETKEGFGIKGIDQKKASSVLEQLKSPFI